jgi:hypothetical protein
MLLARFARASYGSALTGRGGKPPFGEPAFHAGPSPRPVNTRRLLLVTADGRPVYERPTRADEGGAS